MFDQKKCMIIDKQYPQLTASQMVSLIFTPLFHKLSHPYLLKCGEGSIVMQFDRSTAFGCYCSCCVFVDNEVI